MLLSLKKSCWRGRPIWNCLSEQQQKAQKIAEEEMERASKAAAKFKDEQEALKAQLAALVEVRKAEKAAAEDAAREQAKQEVARRAKEEARLTAMEENGSKGQSMHS